MVLVFGYNARTSSLTEPKALRSISTNPTSSTPSSIQIFFNTSDEIMFCNVAVTYHSTYSVERQV